MYWKVTPFHQRMFATLIYLLGLQSIFTHHAYMKFYRMLFVYVNNLYHYCYIFITPKQAVKFNL